MKKILVTALFVVFIFQTASSQLPEGYANWDTEKKIDWLIENMSLEEKVAHLNTSPKGKKSYRQNYDAKYQIPAFVSCDGPRGVKIRGEGVINCPSALNVGAAWDTNLALQLGEAYADQLVHLKSNQIFAPGLNIIRHPQNGRNNEYFSEDPLLTGKIAASNILGIQKNGCIATPKHFVANNFESGRFQVDVTIPERVLHETYMAGFKIAVEEGDPWSIMTSYNSVNGHFLSANKTIMDILYNDWNFRGYAVSDYSAEMETAALAMEAGTHLEMPGWKWYSAEKIQQAFDDGSLSGELFNKRLREVLEIKLSDWIKNPEEYKDSPFNLEQQTALIRRIGSESAVLLKNSGDILPIKKGQKIALFGPFADSDLIKGLQGSSTNRTKRNISVKQALEEEGFDVVYQQAVTGLPPVNQEQKVFFESKAEYFDNINLEGKPKIIRYEKDIQKISFSGAGAAEITDGTIDKAFQFNGQSLLKIGQTPGVKENEDFTWSFWVYLPDQFPDKNGGLLAGYFRRWNEFTFTPSYFTMFLFGPRKKIKLEHTISDQQWSNVVLVRRKGKMISYVNGKKQSEQVFNYALPAAELAIGGSNVTDKNSNCLIDDVRLYNRALSEEEIANTFKKNNTKDGLVFHQPCDNLDKVKEDIESYDEIENPNNLSARFTGVFKPAKSGKYIFNIFSNGGVRFYLEGEEKLNLWNEKWVMGLDHRVWLELEKGKEYNIKVEFGNWYGYNRGKGGFIKMGYYEPDGKILDDIEEASYLAVDADVAVVAVGVPQTPYQGESNDLDHFQLPGYQNELIEMVQNVNPNTVVLLFSAGGVDMNPWLENTQGLVEMFFPGEMGGYCVADVLTGKVNPSGKLPVTYYQSLEDIGVTNYQVKYEDNVYGLGYKYLDKTGKKTLFPFGFGLSYTQFKMKGLKVETEGNRVTVKLKVTNEGNKDGAEVIQAYVSDLEASVDQPVKELGGFNKVFLKAGETKEVTINIAEIALGYYSVKDKKWVIEPGKFEITVGNSSVNLPLKKTIEL